MGFLKSFETHSADVVYDKQPDGGYGWFIVGGHFVNIGIGYGFTKSFGIFFPYIQETYNVDNATTSLIFSLMMFFQYSGSLIGNVLYRQFGPRLTLMFGGLLCSSGLVLITVWRSLMSFYIGVGLMVGLGFSFVILVGSATISRYFKARRPMAIAFAMTGVPLMSILFPVLYEYVYNSYGLFGGLLVIGAIQLHVCVGAAFFRPITLKADGTAQNLSLFAKLRKAFGRLLANPNFLLYSTSIALVISGKFMVNPFIKLYAINNVGLDKYQPAFILSICSGIDIISRPLGGRLCSTKFIREKLGTFETFTISVIGLGLVNLFAPFYVSDFYTFAVYGILFGLCFGLTIGVEWSNVAELVDTDILSDAITFIQLETSIGSLFAPLLGGYISDKTGDYSYVFYIAGTLLLSGAGCAAIVAARRRCSFGEITEEVVEDSPALIVTPADDGFDPSKSGVELNGSARLITGSQVVESRSLLGVNVATTARQRARTRTNEENEKAAAITDSMASLHA